MSIFFRLLSTAPAVSQSLNGDKRDQAQVLAEKVKKCIENGGSLVDCSQAIFPETEITKHSQENFWMDCKGKIPAGKITANAQLKNVETKIGEINVTVEIEVEGQKKSKGKATLTTSARPPKSAAQSASV